MNTINKFYDAPSFRQPHNLEAKITGYADTFSIDLVHGDQKPDCMLGHFGYNFYVRTPFGMKAKRYKTLKSMFNAINRTAKSNNITIESIGIKKYYKYRPIIKF